jgi:hemoglobin
LRKEHSDCWFDKTIDDQFTGSMANETRKRAKVMAEMFLNRIQDIKAGENRVIV